MLMSTDTDNEHSGGRVQSVHNGFNLLLVTDRANCLDHRSFAYNPRLAFVTTKLNF